MALPFFRAFVSSSIPVIQQILPAGYSKGLLHKLSVFFPVELEQGSLHFLLFCRFSYMYPLSREGIPFGIVHAGCQGTRRRIEILNLIRHKTLILHVNSQIHRIIKEDLRGELDKRRLEHYKNLLPAVADRSSTLERRADEAERETDKLKECEWMRHHIDEEFDGVISGITNYGIYVQLPNTVEGMCAVRLMDSDYYIFREDKYELVGERTGRTYRLGDHVRVRVLNADKLTRTIDFQLLGPEDSEA